MPPASANPDCSVVLSRGESTANLESGTPDAENADHERRRALRHTLAVSASSTPPPRLAGGWRDWVLAVVATAVVTVWFVAPVTNIRHLASALYWGDVRLNAWALAWNHRVLSGRATGYWDANIFHPAPGTLAYSEHLFGIALPTWPLALLGAPAALVYNVAWLASFPLLAGAMCLLARRVGLSRAGALATGLISACSWVRIHHLGHLQLLWIFGLPLSLVYLDRWRDRPRLTTLAAWVAAALTTCLASWYLAVLTVLAHLVWWPRCAWTWRRAPARLVPLVIASAGIAVTLVAFVGRYGDMRPGDAGEMRANAADLASYVVPAAATWSGHWLEARGYEAPRWSFGEQTLFLGWTVLALALLGVARAMVVAWRMRSGRASGEGDPRPAAYRVDLLLALIGLGAVAGVLSLGPSSPAATWPLPFDLLAQHEGLNLFRAPARFGLLVSLVVACLAGVGVDALARGRSAAVAGLLVALALVELRPVHFELPPPAPEAISPLYDHLATLPRAAVVSLPTARHHPLPWYDADYEWYATRHWFPIVNGYSRMEPPGHAELMATLQSFPSDEAFAALCDRGVGYIVAHARRPFADFRPAIAAGLADPRLTRIARSGEDVLWALTCRSSGTETLR